MKKYKGIRAASFDTHCLSYGNSGGRLESFKVVIEYDPKADKITSSLLLRILNSYTKNHPLILFHLRRLMPCLEVRLKKESKRS